MKHRPHLLPAFAACLALFLAQPHSAVAQVIPKPNHVTPAAEGRAFSLLPGTRVSVAAPPEDAALLENCLAAPPLRLQVTGDKGAPSPLRLRVVEALPRLTSPEAYTLTVTGDSVVLLATSGAGLFYGVQTLLQMAAATGGDIAPCTVEDEPRFAYRGVMLDVSRHFFGKEFVKRQIDAMARFKLNRLHLHLTDAAGWRLEIKKYPRLTELAAWRDMPVWKDWWNGGRRYVQWDDPSASGGFYTQDDIRELVEYARERYVTIVPEIEMPAHSEEVLTAYPELSCTHEPYRQPDFCVGNEETFRFLQDVLDEVTLLFPSEYIHVGGDEAGKASWRTCPLCQRRMEEEGLKNVDELQSYLIHRIEAYLNQKGRRLLGWDEILDGGLAPGATVMSWRGTEGGLAAVELGHQAVMTPGEFCYLDSYQDAPHTQPPAGGGYLPLRKVYAYDPVPEGLERDKAALIYGVQANLWTEYVPTERQVEWMLYPRALALAEVAWTSPQAKDYEDFRQRALNAVESLRRQGYNPFDLANEVGNRAEAEQPIEHLAVGKTVTYAPGAQYFSRYAAGGDSALVDGQRGGWTYTDKRWQGFIGRGALNVTIDLERETEIHFVGADFMQVCGPEVFLPARVLIEASADGENYTELARHEHDVVKDEGVTFKNFSWEGQTRARYVRYRAAYGRYGGWLFTDEIVVR